MLFGYPLESTNDNWLHDCLYQMMLAVHQSVEDEVCPTWPDIVPAAYRSRLSSRRGLAKHLLAYREKAKDLLPLERELVIRALDDQNQIASLLSGQGTCAALGDLPEPVRDSIRSLFDFAFGLLTDLEIRDKHYHHIYWSTRYHVCPFCGCEYFDAPGAPREALDHFLLESKYPLAATNLRNLVPMGNKCNSRYKLVQDILYRDNGTRRKAYYPYDQRSVSISLLRSVPFAGADGKLPLWEIDFVPDIEETTTWDAVFKIRERYKRDVLDPNYNGWLDAFHDWCWSYPVQVESEAQLIDALARYMHYQKALKFKDRAFIQAAVFEMLHKHCAEGNLPLITFLKSVAQPARQLPGLDSESEA